MTRLLVCAALALEARALRHGLTAVPPSGVDARVIKTGMGPRRAARAGCLLPPYDALAVAGFGGALDAALRPGDVVVADEVRFGAHAHPCASASLLARELTRAGLRVRVGPLLTIGHVVRETERRRLAATRRPAPVPGLPLAPVPGPRGASSPGRDVALAVDMEAGPLAEAAGGRPVAAVRVVVDGPGTPLLGLATLRAGLTARRALRLVGPALTRWARAVEQAGTRPGRAEDDIPIPPPGEVLS
ncbi:lipoprotein [Sphaerisporangium siamense]|uniref:4-hydroxy-3-methylbut-2-enyl diphosphate reductase n=1 Tax=Sphaerisporangium siamense TaxID=795645 RepID=A0A7W7GA95_9ACTN|nr:1-hydroxy-2-methyl-2-butenyl 4-diphosphate reductase [Sphaerisporangium siamense]MBB4699731.1 4-hydroxy-3-methylbut-2-enyl diphosphate reductase [Sphaerisporangium siamense]GII87912.1 lipoprotein [Sphaerisporangium siamense]